MKSKIFDSAAKTIVLTGLLAGTLDALTAILVYKATPLNMFRYIASAAFGPGAFAGGIGMAMWGLLFHYIIAFSWTVLFFLLYPQIRKVSGNKYLNGLFYGVVIWLVMNMLVLPITNVMRAPLALKPAAIGAAILIFAVGLPVSVLIHRYYARKAGGRGS